MINLDWFKKILFSKVDSIGLSIFRMFYSVILFCEVFQLNKFRHIIYDKDPFVYVGDLDVSFLFNFWFILIIFLFFGAFTRFTTIVNYLFSVIVFSSANHFEYHIFYAYVGINFLLIFIPIARVFSIDSVLQKLKYSTISKFYKPDNMVLEVNYLAPVFIAIGLVYFDSIFHKFSSKMWLDGLGVWLPASLPMMAQFDNSFFLNQKYLILFLGYVVLIFEAFFIFLFWFKRFRIPLFIIGVFFHIGILVSFPIPWFALTLTFTYLLLLPPSLWRSITHVFKLKKPLYTFYYDSECPLCIKTVVLIESLNCFNGITCKSVQNNYQNDEALKNFNEHTLLINIHGVNSKGEVFVGYYVYIQLLKFLLFTYPIALLASLPGISMVSKRLYNYVASERITERCTVDNCPIPVYNLPVSEQQDFLIKGWNKLEITKKFWQITLLFFILAQCLMIWFSPFIQRNLPAREELNTIMSLPYNNSKWFLSKYFGITHHSIFIFDRHFENYSETYKVEFINGNKKGIVPLLDEQGMPKNSYLSGAFWTNFNFRVNSPHFNLVDFEYGIIPYLRYFENQNGFNNLKYVFYAKKNSLPSNWEFNFLKMEKNKVWIEVGTAKIEEKNVRFKWNNEMQKILILEKNEKR